MTKEEIILRGQAAQQLMDSGIYRQCLEHLEAQVAESWKRTRPDDADERERLYKMVQAMADLGRVFLTWKGEAVFELHEIERRQKEQTLN